MDRTALIMAGGFSTRLGLDKGLVPLANKPLVRHVLDMIGNIADEKIVVVSSKAQATGYAKALGSKARIAIDVQGDVHSPLVGALTGFKAAQGEYALLVPCDTPLLSHDILLLLYDLCVGKTAAIPRWPNCYVEPLQAVYCVEPAVEASEEALAEGKMNVQSMVDRLRGVRYISTLVLQEIDPGLRTFFNVNTPLDLKKAESILKHTEK